MKRLLILATLAVTGCATSSNDAFIAAHQAASARGVAEAQHQAKADRDNAMALINAVRSCSDDMCKVAITAIYKGGRSESRAASVAPAIVVPPNEFTEFVKVVGNIAVPIYGLWTTAVSGVVQASKGAADAGVSATALNVLTPKLTNSTGQ